MENFLVLFLGMVFNTGLAILTFWVAPNVLFWLIDFLSNRG